MEGRQYAVPSTGLKYALNDAIVPSVLDDTTLRSGVGVLRRPPRGFGLVLNLHLFPPQSVRFSLMKERFLRVQAMHYGRRVGDIVLARMSDLCFPLPAHVDMGKLVVEWYLDDFVYVRETGYVHPNPPELDLFQNDEAMIRAGVIDVGPPFPQPAGEGTSLQPQEGATDAGGQPPVAGSNNEGLNEGMKKIIYTFNQDATGIPGYTFEDIFRDDASSPPSSNTSDEETHPPSILRDVLQGRRPDYASPGTSAGDIELIIEDASTQTAKSDNEGSSQPTEGVPAEEFSSHIAPRSKDAPSTSESVIIVSIDAATQSATDKPEASLSPTATGTPERQEVLVAWSGTSGWVPPEAPYHQTDASTSQESSRQPTSNVITGITWDSYCKEVEKRFQSADKNQTGTVLKPFMMEARYRTAPYDTRVAINRFYQMRQSLRYLDGSMPNFLYDSENYVKPAPYIFYP